MNRKLPIATALVMLIAAGALNAQKQRTRPPKQDNVQTPKDAVDKKAEQRAKLEAEYKMKKEHHYEVQDDSTKKRMKQAMKQAKKLDKRGTTEPFYRRWFRKKNY